MFEFQIRFRVESVVSDSENDTKRVVMVPFPTWEDGLDRINITVPEHIESYTKDSLHFFIVEGDDLASRGSVPPPEWLMLQYDLDEAVEQEKYEEAAWIRDEIERKKNERPLD